MKRKVYIEFVDSKTLKVNTPYVSQKVFDLDDINSGNKAIDLISLKIHSYENLYFYAQVVDGHGTNSYPYEVEIFALHGPKEEHEIRSIGGISRGEQKIFSVYIDD